MPRSLSLFSVLGLSLLVCVSVGGQTSVSPRWRGVVETRFDAVDASGTELSLSDIRGIAVHRDGRIFASDALGHEVHVYAPNGRHLYRFGRQGQGPTDFDQPCCLSFDNDGVLWVRDFGNKRFANYDVSGRTARILRTIRGQPTPVGFVDRIAWWPDGSLIDIQSFVDQSTREIRIRLMALDTSGAILAVDTVASIDKRNLAEFTVGSASGSATFLQPFGSRSLYAFGPRGEHAVAASGTYSIRWFDRRGRLIRTIVGDGSPPPLSQRERDNAARTIASIAERNRLTPSRLPFGIPDRKPVLISLGYDLDGRLWVRRSTADGASQEADVYGGDGKLVARVSWPNNVRLNVFASSGMVAWGVETRADETVGVVSLRFGVVP